MGVELEFSWIASDDVSGGESSVARALHHRSRGCRVDEPFATGQARERVRFI